MWLVATGPSIPTVSQLSTLTASTCVAFTLCHWALSHCLRSCVPKSMCRDISFVKAIKTEDRRNNRLYIKQLGFLPPRMEKAHT